MIMEVKLISCWSLIIVLLLLNQMISTNGFNFKRSNNMGSSSPSSFRHQGKSSTSSDGDGDHFGKSDKHEDDSNHGSSKWSTTGKQYMDSNDDTLSHHHSNSGTNGRKGDKGNFLSDQEFQKARDWKGFVDDWERKAKDELADAINENMKIDGKSDDDDSSPKGRYDGSFHSRDHHDDQQQHHHHSQRHGKNHDDDEENKRSKHIAAVRINKDDSGSNYGNPASNWDWDKEANGAWTRKSDDGQKHDFGKFEKYHQKFADHEHANKGDELDEVTGHNEDKSEDQRYGKKLGGWKKTAKSGDHHFQSGHNKHTSHNNKYDPSDSFKGWDN